MTLLNVGALALLALLTAASFGRGSPDHGRAGAAKHEFELNRELLIDIVGERPSDTWIRQRLGEIAKNLPIGELVYQPPPVWFIVSENIRDLGSELGAEGVKAFYDLGAPAARWWIRYYDPVALALGLHESTISISVDGRGRVRGLDATLPKQAFDSIKTWAEAIRLEVAGWYELDLEALTEERVEDFRPLDSRIRWDVSWKIPSISLGDAWVRVVAIQRGERLSIGSDLVLGSGETPVRSPFSRVSRSSYLGLATALGLTMVFGLGLVATRPPTRGQATSVRPALAIAFVIASAPAIATAVMLDGDTWLVQAFRAAFISTGVLSVGLGLIAVRKRAATSSSTIRAILLAGPPAAWLAGFAACSFSPFVGCCEACTAIRYTSVPLAVLATWLLGRHPQLGPFALLAAASALAPHCICANYVNAPWIELLGAGSPMCSYLGFVVTVLAVMGLRGILPRVAAALILASTVAVYGVGLGHQLLGWPW